ncbi:MAG TPA: NUDIX domain-containing protein [Candidatus Obscuribacterales bacterium]
MGPGKRDKIPQHFTASAVVIDNDHVLLVHHRRIGAWLPPGGHIDDFEMPHEAAVREVFEETGVKVEVLSEALPGTGDADAFFLQQPLCLHGVRAQEGGQDVYHLDIVYLCKPVTTGNRPAIAKPGPGPGLPGIVDCREVKEARWVRLSDLGALPLARNVVEALDLARRKLESINAQLTHLPEDRQ